MVDVRLDRSATTGEGDERGGGGDIGSWRDCGLGRPRSAQRLGRKPTVPEPSAPSPRWRYVFVANVVA